MLETMTATSVDTPESMSTAGGRLDPAPEPNVTSIVCDFLAAFFGGRLWFLLKTLASMPVSPSPQRRQCRQRRGRIEITWSSDNEADPRANKDTHTQRC